MVWLAVLGPWLWLVRFHVFCFGWWGERRSHATEKGNRYLTSRHDLTREVQCYAMLVNDIIAHRRWSSWSQELFGLESVLDLEIAREVQIPPPARYLSLLPPDRTWQKVNDPKVGLKWVLREGEVGLEPRLESCRTMQVTDLLRAMWAWWALLDMYPNVSPSTDAWLLLKQDQETLCYTILVNDIIANPRWPSRIWKPSASSLSLTLKS